MECVLCELDGIKDAKVVESNSCAYILQFGEDSQRLLVVSVEHVSEFQQLVVEGAAAYLLMFQYAVERVRATLNPSSPYPLGRTSDGFPKDHLHSWVEYDGGSLTVVTRLLSRDPFS